MMNPTPAPATGTPASAVHASAASWAGWGILLAGPPGSGKSALLLQLLASGAQLVADDLVRLERRGAALYATAAGATGLIELRGNGIFRTTTAAGVRVSLCVELTPGAEGERLPERGVTRVAGVELPSLRVVGATASAAAQVFLALVARRTD
jgi:HPr kinase/phosphorylase